MRRGMVNLAISILVIVLALIYFYQTKPRRFEKTRSLMDTYITIVAYGGENTPKAIDEAFRRMKDIESTCSIYDPQSEAYLLNRDGYIEQPSKDLFYLMKESLYYFKLTGGSFDITVQPFLELWKEGLWKEDEATQKKKISKISEIVGSDKIVVEEKKIYFKKKGMKVTFGGIAKGYAVDEALRVLKNMGIKDALINAGGDIGVIGSGEGEGWGVALANPDDRTQCITSFLISDRAVATSGNYERYFDPTKKVHHIINPKTGYSANECISVTVIAKSCMEADALATGVFVLGPKKGMELIESLPEVEGLIIDSKKNIYRSSGLAKYEISE